MRSRRALFGACRYSWPGAEVPGVGLVVVTLEEHRFEAVRRRGDEHGLNLPPRHYRSGTHSRFNGGASLPSPCDESRLPCVRPYSSPSPS